MITNASRSSDHCCLVKYSKETLLRKPVENEKESVFRGSRVGPCTDAPTLARSIPSFYSQVHDMSLSIAHEKRNAPQAFTLTHESSDLAHKTSLIISATQNHNEAHTHITVLLFTRHTFKCRSRCFECCVPLLA